MNLPEDYQLLIEDFNTHRSELYNIVSRESEYSAEDFDFLWGDLAHFFESLPQAISNLSIARKAASFYAANSCKGASLEWLPWGEVLFCPASNAVIPVVPTTLLSLLLNGNKVVVAPSRKTTASAKLIVNLIVNRFTKWNDKVVFYEEGGRKAIEQYVQGRKVKLLWFQGDSAHRATVIQDCLDNCVDYVYEGSGNCLTIVDNLSSHEKVCKAADIIFRAALICHGRLCTTPRIVFVSRYCVAEFKKHIQSLSQYSDNQRKFGVFEFAIDAIPTGLLRSERGDDVITLITFERLSDVVKCLRDYCFGIQLAFFTDESRASVLHLFGETIVSRFLFNLSPVFQRSAVAWGGYGFSGPNPVCSLLEKAHRAVVIHE